MKDKTPDDKPLVGLRIADFGLEIEDWGVARSPGRFLIITATTPRPIGMTARMGARAAQLTCHQAGASAAWSVEARRLRA
jgi:hypothetical protein